jgi:ferritin-like metal-binding protein YciE
MEINSVKDMYLAKLQELVSAEVQLGGIFLDLEEAAHRPTLKKEFGKQRQQAEAHKDKLEAILRAHSAGANTRVDRAMLALVRETKKTATIINDNELRDVGLIASAQKLKHYEIAAYGAVATLADQLGLGDEPAVLHDLGEEEKRADKLLIDLAETK